MPRELRVVRETWGETCSAWLPGRTDRPTARASTGHRDRAGSQRTGRSGGCTATPRCSSAVCARCCCSPCIRWPWPGSPTTRATGAIRGGGCSGPALPGGDHLRHGDRRPARGRPGTAASTPGAAASPRTAGPTRRDPHLLGWVHVAEVDSFLRAHQRYGAAPLDSAAATATWRTPPGSAPGVGRARPAAHRGGTGRTDRRVPARAGRHRRGSGGRPVHAAHPPLPLAARPPYAVLAAAAVACCPPGPGLAAGAALSAGRWRPPRFGSPATALVRAIRWAMTAN